jgi:hypothetical protein
VLTATASDVVNTAALELGLISEPLVDPYVGVRDPNIILLRSLLATLGQNLVRQHPWQELQREAVYTITAGQSVYDLPLGYDRVLPTTEWDRSNSTPMNGGLTPRDWQDIKGVDSATGPPLQYRIFGGKLHVQPDVDTPPGAVAFEYVSNLWVKDPGLLPVYRNAPQAGADLLLLDRLLLVSGLKWRYRSSKGFDAAFEAQEFTAAMALAKSADTQPGIISLDGSVAKEWWPTFANEARVT